MHIISQVILFVTYFPLPLATEKNKLKINTNWYLVNIQKAIYNAFHGEFIACMSLTSVYTQNI